MIAKLQRKYSMLKIQEYNKRLDNICSLLNEKVGELPELGVIAGTGLGGLTEDMKVEGTIEYGDLGFPVSTVSSHKGELVWGELSGKKIFVLRGRFHLYEGYQAWEVGLPIRALAKCGMKGLIITNAAGGLDLNYNAGEVMLITDHINGTCENPLIGEHDDKWGERFPDMSKAWSPSVAQATLDFAATNNIKLHKGVYVCVKGPSLETPAETRMYKHSGAQAIGMSTVIEAIVAVQCGVKLLGLSAITNVNDPDDMAEATLEEIVDAAGVASENLRKLISGMCAKWPWQ